VTLLSKAIFVFVMICMLASCQKDKIAIENKKSTETKLFDLSSVSDIDVIEIATKMKNEGRVKNYFQFFLEKNGVPLWASTLKIAKQNQYYIIVPLVNQGGTEVDGFIVAKRTSANSSIIFSLYKKSLLKYYGFSPSKMFNAANVQLLLNRFNRSVFSKETFQLSYAMQLPLEIRRKYPDKTNPRNLIGHLKNNSDSRSVKTLTTSCRTITEDVDYWFDPDGDEDPTHDSGNEYFAYTVSQVVMTFCFDFGDGGGNLIDDWWVANPLLSGGGGGGGGGGGPTLTTEEKILTMLRPGDTYEFINNDPNQPQVPWPEEPANYATVEAFEAAISSSKLSLTTNFDQGDREKITKFLVQRSLNPGGYEFFVKLVKDANNVYKVEKVTSDEWGLTFSWSWKQNEAYTVNVTGNIITIDVEGKENYNLFLEGIGTIYKRTKTYRMKINKLTGQQLSFEEI